MQSGWHRDLVAPIASPIVADVDRALPGLLDRALVDVRDVVDGGLELVSATRRNRNLTVRLPGAVGYLIKQPEPGLGGSETLPREARFYALCARHPRASAMIPLMARLHAFLPEDGTLVLEMLSGARSPWTEYRAHLASTSTMPLEAAAAIGAALATLHDTFRDPELAAAPDVRALSRDLPWSFGLHRPHLGALRRLSPANARLLEIIQTSAIRDGLASSARLWRDETVIHGDVRNENFLVIGEEGNAIRWIDWELVQHGDPAWDVGGALQDFVVFWLLSLPREVDLQPEEMVAAAEYPLSTIRPAIAAFWRAYRSAADREREESAQLLSRAVAYSAVRMLQTAWEHSRRAERPTALAVLSLQVSANIFADVDAAAEELFGLTTD